MADYYYVELDFDSASNGFVEVVDMAVSALLQSGCRFSRMVIPIEKDKRSTKGGKFEEAGIEQLYEVCQRHFEEERKAGKKLIGFPPRWGRIVLEHDFVVDGGLVEEVREEEEETNTHVGEIGIFFNYSATEEPRRAIRMTMSFWEDFLLMRGDHDVHAENLRALSSLVEHINLVVPPVFGAMNSELKLDTDKSYAAFMSKGMPEGNEFVFVGAELVERMDAKALEASKIRNKSFADGARLLQLSDRWGGLAVL